MAGDSVLITGTTSGVGRALLEHYRKEGAAVISVNRRQDRELESAHPNVRFECVDVRDADAVASLVERLSAEEALPDVFLLNAGINEVDNDESFELKEFRSVLQTNLFGVLHFVAPLTRLPASEKRRHIVAIGSMASYVGNPYALGYFTSKRALSACFDVWAHMYEGTDLIFQQVLLGPVPTRIKTMEARFPTWMVHTRDLFSGRLDQTAEEIARFCQTDRKVLFTPLRAAALYLGMRLGTSLVPGLLKGRKTSSGASRRQARGGR